MRALMMIATVAFSTPALAQTTITPSEVTPIDEHVVLEGDVAVTAAMNGQTIAASQGGKVTVTLQVNPSTGAHWAVAAQPDFLDPPTTTISAPAQTNPPRMGAPRLANLSFPVTGAGSGELVLEKRGPGAQSALLETFRVTISAE